jgi:hypothetical protein
MKFREGVRNCIQVHMHSFEYQNYPELSILFHNYVYMCVIRSGTGSRRMEKDSDK